MENSKTTIKIPPFLLEEIIDYQAEKNTINTLFKICPSKRIAKMLYKKHKDNDKKNLELWEKINKFTKWDTEKYYAGYDIKTELITKIEY